MKLKKDAKLGEESTCRFKIDIRNLTNFDLSTRLLNKVYIVWAKKVQRSYLSWHWRVMQNLKENWLVVWEKTWEFGKFSPEELESVKISTLITSFCPKKKMYELKIFSGVMCHDNGEWYKNWRGTDFSI